MIQFITLLGKGGGEEKKSQRSMFSLVPVFKTNLNHFHLKLSTGKKKIKIRCNEQSNKYNGTAHGAMTLLLHKKTLIFGCLFSSQTGTKSKYLNFLEGNISV